MPRSETQIAAHRAEIARRYLRGDYQAAIAADLGVSQQTVSLDLKAIRAAWLAAAIRDFDAARAEELARIDAVERAAWEGWQRSTEDKHISIQEQYDDPVAGTDAKGAPVIKTKTRKHARLQKEGQAGSPAFLNVILSCVERRCSILGLDAPKRFVINWDELTEEQEERLARGEPPEKVLAA